MKKTVTFDIDDTLYDTRTKQPLPKTVALAQQHISNGDRVIIVTARNKDDKTASWVKDNVGDVKTIFTNGAMKADTLNSLGSTLHYDDKPAEINQINKKYPEIETIRVTESMMYANKKAIVYDYGNFLSVAHRLAKDFGTVMYYTPWKFGFPIVNDSLVGTGYSDIVHIDDFWDNLDADLYVFPEVGDGDVQMHLISLGKNVWGSRKAEMLEMSRMGWIDYLKSLDLLVPDTRLVKGLDALQEILEKEDDIYVKIDDKYRGNFETFRSKTWNTTRPLIDKLRADMGPAGDIIEFIAQKAVLGVLEFGFDTWCIDGEFPESLLAAIEIKDAGYIGQVNEFTNMPQGVLEILDKMKPALKEFGYRGNFSAEFRETEDGQWMFTDPCLRFPNPGSFAMMTMCDNFPEILYEGSQGNIIQPIWSSKYGSEIVIKSEWVLDHFAEIFADDQTRNHINRINACIIGDGEWTVPKGKTEYIGTVCLTDDDPDELIEDMKEIYDKIQGYQLPSIDHGMLDEALSEIKKEYDENYKSEKSDDKLSKDINTDDVYKKTRNILMKEVFKGFPDKKHELYKKFEDNIDKFAKAKSKRVAKEIASGKDEETVRRKYDGHLENERSTAFYTARSAFKQANRK